jgi:hypothetical protein
VIHHNDVVDQRSRRSHDIHPQAPDALPSTAGLQTQSGTSGRSGDFEGLAFSPSGELFAVEDSYDRLYSIDVATGAATLVGRLGVSVSAMGLASDDTGWPWMVARNTWSLYRVHPFSGLATAVGSLGVSGLDSLAWDGLTSTPCGPQPAPCTASIERLAPHAS